MMTGTEVSKMATATVTEVLATMTMEARGDGEWAQAVNMFGV
ncbi:uncharacterized protein G2W53_021234 [Senna tora]|uniref:Uncharacterized protein n=1 Tax=Senna tora TaxID=362788 RepID=A0A834TLI4_9FABA|nr:uncharacterized protein G2W53_021234 [Senna tora]